MIATEILLRNTLMLKNKIQNCQLCPLHLSMPETCRPVPGEGPLNAKCMMIGELLGEDEALLERPFMGLAGQFLDKVLKDVDIPREACYITSAVKCYSKLTKPSMKEKRICGEWLKREIELVKPRLIFTFGLWPAKYILHPAQIVRIRDIIGCKFNAYNCRVVPCQSLHYILSRSQNEVDRLEEILKESYDAICR